MRNERDTFLGDVMLARFVGVDLHGGWRHGGRGLREAHGLDPGYQCRGARWLQRPTFDILNTCRSGSNFRQEAGAHFYAQAHISTQPASPLEDAWLSLTYEDQVGSSRAEPSSRRRPQARLSERWFSRLSSSRRIVSAGAGSRAHHPLAEFPPDLR